MPIANALRLSSLLIIWSLCIIIIVFFNSLNYSIDLGMQFVWGNTCLLCFIFLYRSKTQINTLVLCLCALVFSIACLLFSWFFGQSILAMTPLSTKAYLFPVLGVTLLPYLITFVTDKLLKLLTLRALWLRSTLAVLLFNLCYGQYFSVTSNLPISGFSTQALMLLGVYIVMLAIVLAWFDMIAKGIEPQVGLFRKKHVPAAKKQHPLAKVKP